MNQDIETSARTPGSADVDTAGSDVNVDHDLDRKIIIFSQVGLIIVTILAGLFLPALYSSRERSHPRGCTSNLKQIGLALHMYSLDYNEKFPKKKDVAVPEMLRSSGYLDNAKMYTCPYTTDSIENGYGITVVDE